MHFDRELVGVPTSFMAERVGLEVRAQFTVHPLEQVEVEGRGDPVSVVICWKEEVQSLAEVDPDDSASAFPELAPHAPEKRDRFVLGEVAEGRTRKEAETRGSSQPVRKIEVPCEIGNSQSDLEVGELRAQPGNRRSHEILR